MHLSNDEIISLTKIIKMYIDEEHKHFQETGEEDDHIFYDFLRLKNRLKQDKKLNVLKF